MRALVLAATLLSASAWAAPAEPAPSPPPTAASPSSSAPAESSPAPAESLSVPAESSSAPAESLSVPAESSSAPAESLSVPAESSSVPAESSSVPAESSPAATESAPSPASLQGIVLLRDRERPLAGVTVTVIDLSLSTVTDANGRFSFPSLPPGTHALEVRSPDASATVEETLEPGARREVIYRLARPARNRFESHVRAQLRREVVETVVRVDEARHIAGTQGDALKVVQDLPGVARASFGQGQLVVWGAAPADTRVLVDGVEVPALYHGGGFRSVVNDALVRSIEFVPGAYGAAYGRGLGGLVELETRPLPSSGVHGYVGADVLDASALISAAVGKRFAISVSGRYSYLDQILSGIVSPSVGDYVPIPRWDDYQVKATLELEPGKELGLTFLGADDRLTRTLPSSDPAEARRETTAQSFYRLALRYTHRAAGGSDEVTPFFGVDHALDTQQFGLTPTSLGVDAYRYGVRAQARRRVASWAHLAAGADVQGVVSQVSRVGSLTLPAREGDVFVFGQAPPPGVGAEQFSTHVLDAAPYVSADFSVGPVTISPGLRLDAYLIQGNHLLPPSATTPVPGYGRLDWALDPRLAARWQAHERVTVSAAAGLYHQAPDPADLSAVFGNPTLDLERAWHVTAQLAVKLTDALTVETAGFYRGLDQLVTRSPLATPAVARALVQDGSGRAYGGQLLLRQLAWHGLSGWITYTLSRSERQDHPSAPVRLFDYDQTHVLALVASWTWRGLTVGARFRYTSGFPRTPLVGAFFDARDDQFQPLFGAQNSIRLPSFVELDARIEYALKLRRVMLDFYLDVENLTDQKNAEEIVYRPDYSNFAQPGYITGLPTVAVLGARMEF